MQESQNVTDMSQHVTDASQKSRQIEEIEEIEKIEEGEENILRNSDCEREAIAVRAPAPKDKKITHDRNDEYIDKDVKADVLTDRPPPRPTRCSARQPGNRQDEKRRSVAGGACKHQCRAGGNNGT